MTGTISTATQPAQPQQPPAPEPLGPEPTQNPEQGTSAPEVGPERTEAADRLLDAAMRGSVKFYRMRANGTSRAVPYLQPGTKAREVADWIADQVEEGRSVVDVARDAGVSNATVRRALAAIELADAIEWDDELADIYEEGVDAIYLSALNDPDNVQFTVVEEDEVRQSKTSGGDHVAGEHDVFRHSRPAQLREDSL